MKPSGIFFNFFLGSILLCLLLFPFSDVSIADETLVQRIQDCIDCCTDKEKTCMTIHTDARLCQAVSEECIAYCKSEGKSSSEWSDCWSDSNNN